MGKELFERELGKIQGVIDFVASRHRLDPTEREDFASYVMFKLIEDDYRRVRKFRGESRLETYLNVVIQRLFLDFRVNRWGRWRPSARALALGETAVLVERLLYRDGLSRNEVLQSLPQYGVHLEAERFDALVKDIPYHARPREVDFECLVERAQAFDETAFGATERSVTSRKVEQALERALSKLTAEERVLLKLRFLDGCTVREIASSLELDERRLYPRYKRILRRLRDSLEDHGVDREEARGIWRDRIDINIDTALTATH